MYTSLPRIKHVLIVASFMCCFITCSQTQDLAGEYVKKTGAIQYRLRLEPNGFFYFDSYNKVESNSLPVTGTRGRGTPSDPSMSGRGTWQAENGVILFKANAEKDVDYEYPLDFSESKARVRSDPTKDNSKAKPIVKLRFVESGIFWVEGLELEERN